MNPRQFFSSHHWWGKLIGICLGYLTFGPAGAVFGILIGNLFDQGLTEHFIRPHWQYNAEKRVHIQQIFFEAAFSVMGHIAKADGRVTEEQIHMVNRLMGEMHLGGAQKKQAQDYFRKGKQADFDLRSVLTALRGATRDNPELLKLFIDLQFQAALVGGLSLKKQQLLNTILGHMGFSPLHQQHRFYEDFARQKTYQHTSSNGSQSSGSSAQQPRTGTDHAYGILGITKTAGKQDIKRAYRQLISRNHPDKLIAQGLPESMIKIANEKTQQIRQAYEQICAEKGW